MVWPSYVFAKQDPVTSRDPNTDTWLSLCFPSVKVCIFLHTVHLSLPFLLTLTHHLSPIPSLQTCTIPFSLFFIFCCCVPPLPGAVKFQKAPPVGAVRCVCNSSLAQSAHKVTVNQTKKKGNKKLVQIGPGPGHRLRTNYGLVLLKKLPQTRPDRTVTSRV